MEIGLISLGPMIEGPEIEAGMQLRLGDRVGGKYRTGLQLSCFSHPQ